MTDRPHHTDAPTHREQAGTQADHHEGLSADLPRLVETGRGARLGRRGVLGIFGGLGAATLVGCAAGEEQPVGVSQSPASSGPASVSASASATKSATTSTSAATPAATDEIPEETGGPYPADGSNGVNVLTESGVVRSDITRSFGMASAVAAGVPLTIRLRVFDTNGSTVVPYPGAAVYLWHCDRDGDYSLYSDAVAGENYLRGVQAADADGSLEFTSIFPGAYSGRWPHIHFEVYPSVDAATSASDKLRTSQLALPEAACLEVYGAEGYEQSLANVGRSSLDSDMVFADGYSLQLAEVTGSVADGYVATLNVPV